LERESVCGINKQSPEGPFPKWNRGDAKGGKSIESDGKAVILKGRRGGLLKKYITSCWDAGRNQGKNTLTRRGDRTTASGGEA